MLVAAQGPPVNVYHMLARSIVFWIVEGSAIWYIVLMVMEISQANWSLQKPSEEGAPVLTRQESSPIALLCSFTCSDVFVQVLCLVTRSRWDVEATSNGFS